jgi:hypothetical protein
MMSNYNGARYLGVDPIRMFDGSLLLKDEVTDLLSEEAACNDNNFEPVYGKIEKAEKKPKLEKKSKKKRGK